MWGREMRAGLAFVILALLIGQGFREWRRSHKESFQEIVRGLESRDSRDRTAAGSVAGAGNVSNAADSGHAEARAPRLPAEVPVGRIDPNRASESELTRLPGIGPALAERIVTDRERRGVFASPEALLRVRGIGPKTLDRIRGYLSFPAPAGGDSLTGF